MRVGRSKRSMGQVNKLFSISIKSSWPCAFSYSTVMPVRTSRVCWNRSSTASLEGEFSDEGQSNWNRSENNMGEGVKHIDQKLLSSQHQPSHCYARQHIEGVLELVVSCIPWRHPLMRGKKALSSVCPSVHWSLRLSVRLSICPTYFQKKEGKNCFLSKNKSKD